MFTDILIHNDIDYIFTAHHKDDQIETLLMKHYDKSDWISFLGIRDKYRKIIRPMLSIYKKEIISYSTHNNLFWIDDPTNYDNSFRRNKIRNIDLPKIKKTNEKLIDSLFIAHKKAKSNFNEFLSNLIPIKKHILSKYLKIIYLFQTNFKFKGFWLY